jgi:hypothetical protein
MLKVKLKVNPENYEYFKNELEKLGISIDDGAELTLLEENLSQSISVRKEDDIYIREDNTYIYACITYMYSIYI